MMNATENQIFVETVSDQELEMLIGGADRGWIKTLTKDSPNLISTICAGTINTACKICA